jgi:SAM-dependent methyltransferase
MASDPSPPSPSPLALPLAWSLVADAYAAEVVPLFEQAAEKALALAEVGPPTRVLDVATGPGTLALLAAARAREVTAVDFSAEMIEHLRKRASARSLHNVRALVGDGQAMELPDRAFDAAFSLFGLIFFPDPPRGARELLRVLAPGGRAVVSSWPPIERNVLLSAVFSALRAQRPELSSPPGGGPLGDPAGLASFMREAGFTDVAVHEMIITHGYGSVAEAWTSIERSTAPLVLLRRRLGDEAWRPIAAGIEADLGARFGPGPVRLEAPAYLGVGRRP